MRDAINNNPRVQLGVFAVGALLLAFMLMRSFGGSGGGEGTVPPPDPVPAAAAAAAPGAPAPAAAVPPTPAAESSGSPVSLETGPGVPARFADAYNGGEAVALLIRSRRGHSDRAIDRYVEDAVGDRAELIVIGDSRASDYASVISGLNVNRTPALVVVRPRGLSGGAPVGDVLYGFRDERSLRQGVEDALYDGPTRKYSP